jgi:hypothetical protein
VMFGRIAIWRMPTSASSLASSIGMFVHFKSDSLFESHFPPKRPTSEAFCDRSDPISYPKPYSKTMFPPLHSRSKHCSRMEWTLFSRMILILREVVPHNGRPNSGFVIDATVIVRPRKKEEEASIPGTRYSTRVRKTSTVGHGWNGRYCREKIAVGQITNVWRCSLCMPRSTRKCVSKVLAVYGKIRYTATETSLLCTRKFPTQYLLCGVFLRTQRGGFYCCVGYFVHSDFQYTVGNISLVFTRVVSVAFSRHAVNLFVL